MANLGKIAPQFGRWFWPFKQMQEGDEFHVNYEDRLPEDVRHLAGVRAAQIGIRISCIKDDTAGCIRIKRVPYDRDEDVLPVELTYEQFKHLVRRQYKINADDIRWGSAYEIGETFGHRAPRVEPDARSRVVVVVADIRYEVELAAEGLAMTMTEGPTRKIVDSRIIDPEAERNGFDKTLQELMS